LTHVKSAAAGVRYRSHVELSAKILGEEGKIVDAKTFRASAPAKGADAPPPRMRSMRRTAAALVTWAAQAIP
jgi:hypothetical protein